MLFVGCAARRPKAATIHAEAFSGNLVEVQRQVSKGVDVNLNVGNFGTPLHQAAMGGHLEVAQWLLDHGATVDAQNSIQTTPLYDACLRGKASMVELLVKHRANPNLAKLGGHTPLFANLTRTGNVEIITGLLLQAGADPNIKNQDGWAPIHLAAERGDLPSVKYLLEAGAPVDALSDTSATPLLQAASFGQTNVVAFLLNRKAKLEKRNVQGTTPLIGAANNGHDEVCRLLTQAGARLDATDDNKVSALLAALVNEHWSTARLLVDAGAVLPPVPTDAMPGPRFYSALFLKLLADKQFAAGQAAEGRAHYATARATLVAVREEFTAAAKANNRKAATKEFWGAVFQGFAMGLSDAAASYNSYQSYKTSAQISALRHARTYDQYHANAAQIMSYQEFSQKYPYTSGAEISSNPGGSDAGSLRLSAAVLNHRAQVCTDFIQAIDQIPGS